MTSFAFILGSLPLVVASGAGAASRHSIGTTVVGGMLAVTVLGALLVPAFYVAAERLAEWRRRAPGGFAAPPGKDTSEGGRRRASRAAPPRRLRGVTVRMYDGLGA